MERESERCGERKVNREDVERKAERERKRTKIKPCRGKA